MMIITNFTFLSINFGPFWIPAALLLNYPVYIYSKFYYYYFKSSIYYPKRFRAPYNIHNFPFICLFFFPSIKLPIVGLFFFKLQQTTYIERWTLFNLTSDNRWKGLITYQLINKNITFNQLIFIMIDNIIRTTNIIIMNYYD